MSATILNEVLRNQRNTSEVRSSSQFKYRCLNQMTIQTVPDGETHVRMSTTGNKPGNDFTMQTDHASMQQFN
jgi:hypothetical protein